MNNPAPWLEWIGLPHRPGADPTEGEAACCLVMAQRLLHLAGEEEFRITPEWYDWFAAGDWDRIEHEFRSLTYPCPAGRWALVPFWGPPFGLGVVLPDQLILIPHHTRGVIAAPFRAFSDLTFHRVLPALVA